MNWNISWLAAGAAAYLLVGVNFIRTALGKTKGWQTLLFASLSCGALTLLEEYRMVVTRLQQGDIAALEDVVPFMTNVLAAALYLGIALNLVVLVWQLRRSRNTEQ